MYNMCIDSAQIIKRLKREGWKLDRVRGSHHVFRRPDRAGIVVVAHPRRDIPIGTARNVYRAAGWTWEGRR